MQLKPIIAKPFNLRIVNDNSQYVSVYLSKQNKTKNEGKIISYKQNDTKIAKVPRQ